MALCRAAALSTNPRHSGCPGPKPRIVTSTLNRIYQMRERILAIGSTIRSDDGPLGVDPEHIRENPHDLALGRVCAYGLEDEGHCVLGRGLRHLAQLVERFADADLIALRAYCAYPLNLLNLKIW